MVIYICLTILNGFFLFCYVFVVGQERKRKQILEEIRHTRFKSALQSSNCPVLYDCELMGSTGGNGCVNRLQCIRIKTNFG